SRPWDVARLQRLLSLTGDAPHGVTMNESGCFQPLHSILGLLLSEETELSSAGRFHGVGG
ncbi:MAG: hypothetical protein WAU13_06250, partial [Albidovulum sp.]